MRSERGLPLARALFRRLGIPFSRLTLETSRPAQPLDEKEIQTPPSLEEINGELDFIKFQSRQEPYIDQETGVSYFGLQVPAKNLRGISEQTKQALQLDGRGGFVDIVFAYGLGVARKITLQRKSAVASFIILTDPRLMSPPWQMTKRKEASMTAGDALLVAKLGKKLTRGWGLHL